MTENAKKTFSIVFQTGSTSRNCSTSSLGKRFFPNLWRKNINFGVYFIIYEKSESR